MRINEIIQGDSLAVLKTLETESIDCCITSPPYWGLRDYGTAKWEGGDEKCKHMLSSLQSKSTTLASGTIYKSKRQDGAMPYKEICGKCGAKRKDLQLGLEKTPEEYVAKMVEIFREVKRVLKKEGTCWLNLGDSYNGNKTGNTETNKNPTRVTNAFKKEKSPHLKDKDLCGIPWRVAFALQADGWYLRQDIIWNKPNPMPESANDRCTKSHEYVFLLAKSPKYYFDNEAIKEDSVDLESYQGRRFRNATKIALLKGRPGTPNTIEKSGGQFNKKYEKRNKRSVWTITTKPFKESHFATFPEDLIAPMVKAGCPKNGLVLDPFMGAGTTAVVARKLGRNYLGIELNPAYIKITNKRLAQQLLF